MIVTIHQPNFLPWYPFFQKIEQADVFVILGHCQFEKNGYQNRFFLKDKWNTMSAKKGLVSIKEKSYVNCKQDWNKIKSYLVEYKDVLTEIDNLIEDNLYVSNLNIIKYLLGRLNIKTQIVEDYETNLTSTSRLVDLCKYYGATTYLAGQGGKNYLDESEFESVGIKVTYQENLNKIHTLEYLKNEATRV